jgi:hypothetical protein
VDTYDKLVNKLRQKYTKQAINMDDIIDKLEQMQPAVFTIPQTNLPSSGAKNPSIS